MITADLFRNGNRADAVMLCYERCCPPLWPSASLLTCITTPPTDPRTSANAAIPCSQQGRQGEQDNDGRIHSFISWSDGSDARFQAHHEHIARAILTRATHSLLVHQTQAQPQFAWLPGLQFRQLAVDVFRLHRQPLPFVPERLCFLFEHTVLLS